MENMGKKYNYTYQIKNLINGKTYIGVHSTDDLNDGYMGSGVRLKQSIKKYGKENFVKTIMCFFDTVEEMYEEERFLVDEKWIKSVNNYNISLGGNGGLIGENHPLYGKSLSEETKRKLSESKKGENHPLYGIKGIDNPNYGRTHTKEARIKMSEKLKGEKNYWYGKETPMKGKTHTEKTKQKISEKLSGENHPLFKNKKSGLPLNILHTKNEKKPYYVKVKGKYLGAYSTIEEAIIVRDNYINKK